MEIYDSEGNLLPRETTLLDIAQKVNKKPEGNYYPDYYLRGFYSQQNHNTINKFKIDPMGSEILFITGIPHNLAQINRYKFKGCRFQSYWEDTKMGYLFQVLPAQMVYVGVSKSMGAIQFQRL